MPATPTLPLLSSTVTVPAVPPKMAKLGCGVIGPTNWPLVSDQVFDVTDHVPLPPPIEPGPARPLASHSLSVKPCVSIRLICLSTVRTCSDMPGGGAKPPPVMVSVSPQVNRLYRPGPMPPTLLTLSVELPIFR